jgi:hypothetical protein
VIDNPYAQVGQVAYGDHFVERSLAGRRIERSWQREGVRPGNLSVLGYHRTGKTSLVRWAADGCPRTDLQTVFIDVGTLASGEAMFQAIVRETLAKGPFSPGATAAGNAALGASTWDDLRQAVIAFFTEIPAGGHYVMIVLDEFDRASLICKQLAEFQLLRNLASEQFPVGLITISRRRVADIEIDAAGGSILDGVLSLKQPVGMFAPAEADVMLDRAQPLGIDLRSVRRRIADLTGLHPYLLELLCHSIVEHYQETGKVDVERAYQGEQENFFQYFKHLAEVIQADLGEGGIALVRALASGTSASSGYPHELAQLRYLGLIPPDADPAVLFAPLFAQQVLEMRDAAAKN